MGLIRHMAKEAMKEIGNKSREFYEFVLPPVDLHLEGENLIVTVDLPGFDKKNIQLSIHRNILSIKAEKKEESKPEKIIWKQRPDIIDKKIRLPIHVKEGEESGSAKFAEGVLIIKIPTKNDGKMISIE